MSAARALLVARTQSELNRLRRELGGAGFAALAVVASIVVLAATPPAIGAYVVGHDAALRLAGAGPSPGGPVLGRLHALVWLAFGLLGGLLGDEVSMPQGVRVFPVPPLRLFAAELAASAAAPLPVLTAGCLLGLSAGAATADPALAPLELLLAVEGLVLMLVMQRWIAAGRHRLSQRPLWPALALAAAVGSWAMLAERGSVLTLSRQVLAVLLHAADALPTSAAWRGLATLAEGRPWHALLLQLAALSTTAALVAAAAWLSRLGRSDESRRARRRSARLWSFRTPASGIARLLVKAVAESRAGRTLLLMPTFIAASGAVTALTIGTAQARLEPGAAQPPLVAHLVATWSTLVHLPWAGLLPPLVVVLSSELWMNQFGWDGPGVKTLLALPIAPRELLLGKMLGMVALTLLQLALLAPLLLAAAWRAPLALVWGLAAAAVALVALGALGHVFSAGLPRPADRGSAAQGLTGMLLAFFANASVIALLAAGHQLAQLAGPLGPPVALSLLAVVTIGIYLRLLDALGTRVMAQRDQLITQLG